MGDTKVNPSIRGDRKITPVIRGFMHVALMRRLSMIPFMHGRERRQAIENYGAIQNEDAAREYIQSVRAEVRAYKSSVRPPRSNKQAGKATS